MFNRTHFEQDGLHPGNAKHATGTYVLVANLQTLQDRMFLLYFLPGNMNKILICHVTIVIPVLMLIQCVANGWDHSE